MTAKQNYLLQPSTLLFEVNTITCVCGKVNDVRFWSCKKCGRRLQ